MSYRGPAHRLLRGILLAASLLSQWPRPAHAETSLGISNLGSRLCKANPFIVWANETGEGSAGALMVWLLATRDILPYCDLHLVAPEGAGVVMHFLSANLRKTPPRRPLRRRAAVLPPGIEGCVDTVTVEHVPSEEAYSALNNSNEEARSTTLVETTCAEKKLTARYHLSPYEVTHASTRIRLVVGDRDEKSIVGYQLKFNIYLHGNWSTCPYGDQFRCKDDNCIWNKLICDGAMNCPDMSDEYEATHANCRDPFNLGLQILCFFGAVGAIVITLLTLDALGRYVLHSREVRFKQTHRPRVRPKTLLVAEEEQAVAPVHGAHGTPINLLDRDLALFEKQAGAEPHDKKEKTVKSGKEAAPIEMAPRLGSPSRHPHHASSSSSSSTLHGMFRHGKSMGSSKSRTSFPRHELTDGKMSMLSYDLDFDADSSRLRVPDVTPEDTMLVEDDKHFPSDKPLKTSEAFMRLLELTVGKKSVPEQAKTPSAISPQPCANTPTGSMSTSLDVISSSTKILGRGTSPLSSPSTSPTSECRKSSRTPRPTPEQSGSPCSTLSSQPVPSLPRTVSKTSGERPGSSPSSSDDSKTAPPRSAESSGLKEHRDGQRHRIDSSESKARTAKRSSSQSKRAAGKSREQSERSKKHHRH